MMKCRCIGNGTVDIIGLCDSSKIDFSECSEFVNTTEISIPEILTIPCEKPCIESIDKVFVDVKIISKRVIKTPAALDVNGNPVPNEEGTFLTGSKLVVEGILCQKVVYTADLPVQSVHSAHFKIPFSAFIMLPLGTDVDEDKFCVQVCVEDVFVKQICDKQIFKNVTLFLRAKLVPLCNAEKTDPPVITLPILVGDTTVSGTAEPDSLIILCLNGVPQPPALADENGDWTVTVPPLVAPDIVSVTAKAPEKLVSDPVVEKTPQPVITVPIVVTDTSVTGTAEVGAIISLTVNGGTPVTATADGAGNWTVTGLTALAAGDVIIITAKGAGKLVSDPVSGTTADPTINPVTPGDLAVSGTAEPGAAISVTVTPVIGIPVTVTTTAVGGIWLVGVTPPLGFPLIIGDVIDVTATNSPKLISNIVTVIV